MVSLTGLLQTPYVVLTKSEEHSCNDNSVHSLRGKGKALCVV